ncbi:MAG: hypothetical protein GX606_02330, partial [Elusimicrobia bacterium]|nr:hypothetical protein [Elusimicrobiota bacterium]
VLVLADGETPKSFIDQVLDRVRGETVDGQIDFTRPIQKTVLVKGAPTAGYLKRTKDNQTAFYRRIFMNDILDFITTTEVDWVTAWANRKGVPDKIRQDLLRVAEELRRDALIFRHQAIQGETVASDELIQTTLNHMLLSLKARLEPLMKELPKETGDLSREIDALVMKVDKVTFTFADRHPTSVDVPLIDVKGPVELARALSRNITREDVPERVSGFAPEMMLAVRKTSAPAVEGTDKVDVVEKISLNQAGFEGQEAIQAVYNTSSKKVRYAHRLKIGDTEVPLGSVEIASGEAYDAKNSVIRPVKKDGEGNFVAEGSVFAIEGEPLAVVVLNGEKTERLPVTGQMARSEKPRVVRVNQTDLPVVRQARLKDGRVDGRIEVRVAEDIEVEGFGIKKDDMVFEQRSVQGLPLEMEQILVLDGKDRGLVRAAWVRFDQDRPFLALEKTGDRFAVPEDVVTQKAIEADALVGILTGYEVADEEGVSFLRLPLKSEDMLDGARRPTKRVLRLAGELLSLLDNRELYELPGDGSVHFRALEKIFRGGRAQNSGEMEEAAAHAVALILEKAGVGNARDLNEGRKRRVLAVYRQADRKFAALPKDKGPEGLPPEDRGPLALPPSPPMPVMPNTTQVPPPPAPPAPPAPPVSGATGGTSGGMAYSFAPIGLFAGGGSLPPAVTIALVFGLTLFLLDRTGVLRFDSIIQYAKKLLRSMFGDGGRKAGTLLSPRG